MNDGKATFLLFLSFCLISISRTSDADSNISSFLPLPAILASTEAKKDSARHAQPDTFKILKESRHAKNVQSTRISLKKASHRTPTVLNALMIVQLVFWQVIQKHQHASASVVFTTVTGRTAWPVQKVLTVVLMMV